MKAKKTRTLAASFVVVTSVMACGKEAKPGSSSGGACEPPNCVMNPPPPTVTPLPLAAADAGTKK